MFTQSATWSRVQLIWIEGARRASLDVVVLATQVLILDEGVYFAV